MDTLNTTMSSVDVNTDEVEAKLDTLNTTLTTSTINVLSQVNNLGSYGNIENNASLLSGANSSSVDISSMNYGSIFYEDSSTASMDSIRIEVSPDGTNWVKYADSFPIVEGGSAVRTASNVDMCFKGLTHIRVVNNSAVDTYTNVVASVVGSN